MRIQRWILVLLVILASRAFSQVLEMPGGAFGTGNSGAKSNIDDQAAAKAAGTEGANWGKIIQRKVKIPAPGIWYFWLKVRSKSQDATLLTYDLDGRQPLRSARREILIQPHAGSHWVNFSRFSNFKIEVNVDKPGEHAFNLYLLEGDVEIEKIYATLYYSAKMKDDRLDMTGDPGHGRLGPMAQPWTDGARDSYRSPAIKAANLLYYVDALKGDDKATGLSDASPWRSLAKVNALNLQPGDAVLLKRGSVWQEALAPRGNGTAQNAITLGAYGEGERPLIDGVNKPALSLTDQSYWTIQDLRFCNNPDYRQSAFHAFVTSKTVRCKALRVLNCDAFDSGNKGFEIGGGLSWDGVFMENCRAYCNTEDGIIIGGDHQKASRNTVIRHCTAYTNLGRGGIWIAGGENGLIEECLSYNNACVNIWAFNACNITMRRCEAFRGRPPADAAGFDIDFAVEASTLEYCYSHDNEGDAYLLMGSGEGIWSGYHMHSAYNVIRYCVADGNSSLLDMIETFKHGIVANNLAIATGPQAKALTIGGWPDNSAVNIWKGGGWPSDAQVIDNIFVAREGAILVSGDDKGTQQNNRLDYNLYWTDAKVPAFRWGGRERGPKFWKGDPKFGTFPAPEMASLTAFQKASQQEAHGLQLDPQLVSIGAGDYGRLPLASARLKASSPAIGSGRGNPIDETWLKGRRAYISDTGAEAYGIPMEPLAPDQDYWGKKLDKAAKASRGPQAP
jgi:hypothetical protein